MPLFNGVDDVSWRGVPSGRVLSDTVEVSQESQVGNHQPPHHHIDQEQLTAVDIMPNGGLHACMYIFRRRGQGA